MTLNITMAARWLMVQSSDFRLTQGGRITVSETAQKQVVLQYYGWSGLICYTGIATYGAHDTARWLGQVLVHDAGERTPDQVARRVASTGNRWLRKIPAKDRTLHTFTLVAHARDRAHIYLISNQEQFGRPPLPAPDDTFLVSHSRVRGTTCVITGCPAAVTRRQREDLERLLASNPPPLEMREAVAFANREAAPRANNMVGEECVVAHLLPDGTGGAAVFGRLKGRYLPSVICNGLDQGKQASQLKELGGGRNPRTLAGLDWRSLTDKGAMVMYLHDPALHTGSGWPPEDAQVGGVGIRLVEE